jgi:hypothetical protein
MTVSMSRRRALLAVLGATTVASTAEFVSSVPEDGETGRVATEGRVATATAVADVVYPSQVDVDADFVERRVFDRIEPTPGHFEGLAEAVDDVERVARSRTGASVASLPPGERRRLLDEMGVFDVHATPDGTVAERVRYYLVNDLLYGLFTHPKGGRLMGVPNPPGYFGGNELYRRGPDDGDA